MILTLVEVSLGWGGVQVMVQPGLLPSLPPNLSPLGHTGLADLPLLQRLSTLGVVCFILYILKFYPISILFIHCVLIKTFQMETYI